MSRHTLLVAALAAVLGAPCLVAQNPPAVKRPPIIGVAHIGLKTDDLAAARKFYGRDLGFAEAFSLDKPTGGLMLTYFKVNDHQYIEIYPTLTDPNGDRLTHVAFETTDVRQLREYLASHGVKVPESLKPGLDGNLSLMVKDPEGHNVEFVQYLPGSLHSRNFGKFLPETRISDHMIHVGFVVDSQAAEDAFFKDILGFVETWHGGMKDDVADWIDMRVPDGHDWLEYMLHNQGADVKRRGVMNHLALGTPSVEQSFQTLTGRGMDLQGQKPKIGRDGKWQLNLYDANFTRAELMEPKPVEKPCCSAFKNQ